MTRTFAIAPYPLSSGFRARLAAELGGEPVVLDVPTLRRLGTLGMLRALLAHRGQQCLLPLEDPASTALRPVLHLLAAASLPASIEVVTGDMTRSRLSRLGAVGAVAGLVHASAVVRREAGRSAEELAGIARLPRADARLGRGDTVLYVNGNLWFGVKAGGSIGHIAGVVNGMLDAGLAVEVAAVSPPPLVRGEARYLQLEPPRTFGLPSELNQYRFSRSTAAALAARATPDRHRFVYQRLSLGNYAGVAIARAAGLPLVLEYNGSEVWIARNWGTPMRNEALALAAEEACLREAAVVVTVSQVLGDELQSRGVEPSRVVVYPNCVDESRFDPVALEPRAAAVRTELGIPADAVVVTFVGTFGRWHGAEVLARAIRRLAEGDVHWLEQHRVHFLFVGDGLRLPAVREIVGRACDRVIFTGLVPQEATPSYLAASDVLVSPHVPNDDGTPFFGSPTKLFEYLAMGRAVVASDLDQIGDVLTPALDADDLPLGRPSGGAGELAVLTRPGDVDSLIRGLRFAVERPDWRLALGQAARRRVSERYTWRHHVAAILGRVEERCRSRA